MVEAISVADTTPPYALRDVAQLTPVEQGYNHLIVDEAYCIDDCRAEYQDDAVAFQEDNGGYLVQFAFSPIGRYSSIQRAWYPGQAFIRPHSSRRYSLDHGPLETYIVQYWSDGAEIARPMVGMGRIDATGVDRECLEPLLEEQLLSATGTDRFRKQAHKPVEKAIGRLIITSNIIFTNYCLERGIPLPFFNSIPVNNPRDEYPRYQRYFTPTPEGNDQFALLAYARFTSPLRRDDDLAATMQLINGGIHDMNMCCYWLNKREIQLLQNQMHKLEGIEITAEHPDKIINRKKEPLDLESFVARTQNDFSLTQQQAETIYFLSPETYMRELSILPEHKDEIRRRRNSLKEFIRNGWIAEAA